MSLKTLMGLFAAAGFFARPPSAKLPPLSRTRRVGAWTGFENREATEDQ